MLYKFYIGSNNQTGELETAKIADITSSYFDGYTAYETTGYWQGKAEKSLCVEIEKERQAEVKQLAEVLKIELNQQAIGLAQIGKLEFI